MNSLKKLNKKVKANSKTTFTNRHATVKEEGYSYIAYLEDNLHLLLDRQTEVFEVFASRKSISGWGLRWKNTILEFCYSINPQNPKNEWEDLIYRMYIFKMYGDKRFNRK